MFIKLFILLLLVNSIFPYHFCTNSNKPPEKITDDPSKIINPVIYKGNEYLTIQAGKQIFLNKNTANFIGSATSAEYEDSTFCPEDFKIPTKLDYESLISELGSNAYSYFSNENGLNMKEKIYYLTNTIAPSGGFNKYFLYLEDNSIKFADQHPFKLPSGVSGGVRCMISLAYFKNILPVSGKDLDLNQKAVIKNSFSKYFIGYIWKIGEEIFKAETIEYAFTISGGHKIEFWGKYSDDLQFYLCDYIFVNKKSVSSTQTFAESKIKAIETDFKMYYSNTLHFIHSNSPTAPKDNGGYYIAVSDMQKYLHVLSYDKSDNLIKDFNTTEKAYPNDITSTDYGFAIYMIDAANSYHSYLNLYNKNYELINTVQIMNNSPNDDKTKDSNLEKQIIKYDSTGTPVFGMRFMYNPDNGKLIYSRGRIFLIFDHYNHFLDSGGHTGDTVTTFNEILLDMNFGITWGASHSLIQSATFDNNYFWTAALSDAYPEGIKVEYTSKTKLTSAFDPVNQKYNSLMSGSTDQLAGYIKGYHSGPADGKLGGILYFEKYELYCLVYAKTPNYSDDSTKNGKTIIFISTWKFEENQISNNKTYEIKIFDTGNVMQLRAGKYGDNQIVIIYAETSNPGHNSYGNIPKGTIPKVFVVSVPDMQIIINDQTYDKLLMNTNEDLRTFRDGVLIWGTSNADGKLVINKIGTPLLDDSYEDIKTIITKEEVDAIKNGIDKDEQSDENEDERIEENEEEQNNENEDEQKNKYEEEQNNVNEEEKNNENEEEQNKEYEKEQNNENEEEQNNEYEENNEGEEEREGQGNQDGGDNGKGGDDNYSLSNLAIVGIVLGICAAIALLFGIYCFMRRKRLKNKDIEDFKAEGSPLLKQGLY